MAFKKNEKGVMGVETVSDSCSSYNSSLEIKSMNHQLHKTTNPTVFNNFAKPAPPGASLLKSSVVNKPSTSSLLKNSQPPVKDWTELEREKEMAKKKKEKQILKRVSKIKNLSPFNLLDHLSEEEILALGGEIYKATDKPLGFERNLEPEGVLGGTKASGELMLLVKWKGSDEADFVPAREMNLKYPQLVIQYYEDNINISYEPSTSQQTVSVDVEDPS